MSAPPLDILLIQPRGFCAGVKRAIEIVEAALAKYGPPVWVLHEIVHNRFVIEDLANKGAIFTEELDEIPHGVVTIFSAHGVPRQVEEKAADRDLQVIDATCPLVKKVHHQAIRYAQKGYHLLLIGHHGHPEVMGTLGRVPKGTATVISNLEEADSVTPPDPDKVAYVTQTTLSVDDTKELIEGLKGRFPNIVGPSTKDICYATQSRQEAVKKAASRVEMLLVVGSKNSSNSNRLRETGRRYGVESHLIDDHNDLDPQWLAGVSSLGITAGASAPEHLVQELVEHLKAIRPCRVKEMDGAVERSFFRPPRLPDFDPS